MPTRILREGIISSEQVNSLSERAELFYRKLMSVVDDYGRFFANPISLLGACYPLRPEVTEAEVLGFLNECVKVGLVCIYGKGKYLVVAKFKQQTRSPSKFPEPTKDELLIKCESNVKQMCRVVVGEGVFEDAGVGLSNFQKLAKKISAMYGRKEGQPMSYAEESSLAEVARRPSVFSELEELERFKAKPDSFFPQSLYKLASGWGEVLDRARANGVQQKPKVRGWIPDSNYDSRTPQEKAEQQKRLRNQSQKP